jgi:hypothetical protein
LVERLRSLQRIETISGNETGFDTVSKGGQRPPLLTYSTNVLLLLLQD